MKQRALTSLILFLSLLAGCTPRDENRPLQWGADAEGGAPYIFIDPEHPDANKGFEVDLVAALSDELQRPIEFHQYQYDSLLQGLDRGDVDFAMNGLEVTPDRREKVRFSKPYYVYQLQLVTRADEKRFTSLAELKALGGTVGTLGETAASRLLEKDAIKAKLYDSQLEPYTDLELGRVDAVLLDLPIAVYYAQPNKHLKFLGEPFAEGEYAIAFRKDDEELAAQFDAAIDSLAAKGKLKEIYEKWRIWNNTQEKLGAVKVEEDVVADSGRAMTFDVYFPLLCESAVVTIEISVLSMALAMALGLVVAVCRLYGPLPLRWAALGYVEFFRGIPVLLLLYLLYYALPTILNRDLGIPFKPSDFTVAILAFGLNYAAYEAEIYRAGIGAIPLGQWEAAASLGMSRFLTFRRIILPQAIKTILPPVTNDFVALFKDTSVVSVIAVVELTKRYQMLSKSSLKYLEIGVATAVLYLIMSIPLGYLARYLEKRWGKGV